MGQVLPLPLPERAAGRGGCVAVGLLPTTAAAGWAASPPSPAVLVGPGGLVGLVGSHLDPLIGRWASPEAPVSPGGLAVVVVSLLDLLYGWALPPVAAGRRRWRRGRRKRGGGCSWAATSRAPAMSIVRCVWLSLGVTKHVRWLPVYIAELCTDGGFCNNLGLDLICRLDEFMDSCMIKHICTAILNFSDGFFI